MLEKRTKELTTWSMYMEIINFPLSLLFIINLSFEIIICIFRPNKKISVFRVTGLKNLGRVGTHILKKIIIILCILKSISPFKMQKIIYFPENVELLGFTSKFR